MNEVKITPTKLGLIIITAILGSAISTTFSLLRVATSDHFAIVALESRTTTIEETIVPRGEFTRFEQDINRRLDRIDQKLDKLLEQ